MAKMLRGLSASLRSHEMGERKWAERNPLVQAVLDQFPGAEVVKVTRGYDEAKPPKTDECGDA